MADYYPLLARAVAGLQNSTPDARKAIYERAKKALLGQLSAMQPPPPPGAIEREALALDEAVARVEREIAVTSGSGGMSSGAPAPASTPKPAASEPPTSKPPASMPPASMPPASGLAEPDPYPGDDAPVREALRPAAPKPVKSEGGGLKRLAIIVGALALVGAMVGFAAWKLRDKPEELAKLSPPAESASPDTGGKIGERIGADSAAARPAAEGPALPVAYRAAILTRDASEPGGVKTYVGTVVWRRESANRGPNAQLVSSIRADVDLPEAKFKASVVIEKNFDPSLSFSHTINIRFFPGEGSPIGNITAVGMPEMRGDEQPKGVALQGLPVEISANAFLAGLNQAAAEQNRLLLANPKWMDIQLSLSNGSIAKITMEKGAGGEKIFSEVLAEWAAK